MATVLLDTHSIIWYLSDASNLSSDAESAIDEAAESGAILVSAITVVELVYLVEKGRVPSDVLVLLLDVIDDTTMPYTVADLTIDVAKTLQKISRSDIPDMPDRIIAATGLALGLPIVTKDSAITKCADLTTIW